MSLAVAPNGRTVVSGGRDRVVMVWDVLGGRSGASTASSSSAAAPSGAPAGGPVPLKMLGAGLGSPSTMQPIKKLEVRHQT
jgi:WD40 repeat protein